MTRGRLRGVGQAGLCVLVVGGALFPIYFMLIQSLKTPQEDVFGYALIVRQPTLDNYRELFGEERRRGAIIGRTILRSYPFMAWLENTMYRPFGVIADEHDSTPLAFGELAGLQFAPAG